MPNGEQRRQMSRFAGCARYVYNKALALKKELYEKKEQVSRFQLDKMLVRGSRKRRGFLKPQRTHSSKPFSTSTVPIRISFRSAPLSRSFTRKDCGIRSVSLIRSASS
jgi:hypothetical protein